MPSNPRKNKSRAILDHHTRRLAEQACEHVLETWELPGASGSQPKYGGDDHACAPAPDLATGRAPQPERKCGGHGGDDDNPIAAAASEDAKRALVPTRCRMNNDLSRMLVQYIRAARRNA